IRQEAPQQSALPPGLGELGRARSTLYRRRPIAARDPDVRDPRGVLLAYFSRVGERLEELQAQRGRRELLQQRLGLVHEARAAFGGACVDAPLEIVEQELREGPRFAQLLLERLRALLPHEAVRVVLRRKEQEAHRLVVGEVG